MVEEFLDPIGLDLRDFAGSMTGGWLFGYVAALREAGWRPMILCASRAVQRPVRLVHADTRAPIWAVPGRAAPPGRSASGRALRQWLATPVADLGRALRQEGCSVLLVQEYEDARFDRLVRWGRRRGLDVFATFQGGDRTLSRLERLVRRRSLELARGLVVASSAERLRLQAAYPGLSTPVAPIPNPVDASAWGALDRRAARRELGLDPDAFIAINHGRVDVLRKGHDVLLDAWRRSSPGTLVLIGSGQDDGVLERMLDGVDSSSVRWERGYSADRERMRLWLSAADLYVGASRVEGMPVAPLEAMACGLPVVATRAQGLEEIVGSGADAGGILVDVDDGAQLAAAILRLRNDDGLRLRLARMAAERAGERFSPTSVGSALTRFIEDGRG